ncbi:MAG: hypothetical protein ACXWZB_03125 [Gaiellaceae bacterium]
MTTEDTRETEPSGEAAADAAALEQEVRMLQEIRDGLASQPGVGLMVTAVSGLIEEREAQLEHSRRP